jgi:hypothetical protein
MRTLFANMHGQLELKLSEMIACELTPLKPNALHPLPAAAALCGISETPFL